MNHDLYAPVLSFIGVIIAASIGYLGVRTQQIHKIVNSQRTEMMEKIEGLQKLISAIQRADAVKEAVKDAVKDERKNHGSER